MSTTDFAKYQGLGNDFVVLAGDERALPEPGRVRNLCDRHFGIGADGVLVVVPASIAGARARMIVLNADGSRPEMCGNGLRCVALFLAQRDGLERAEYQIETDAGVLACTVSRGNNEASVRVRLGKAQLLGSHQTEYAGSQLVFARSSLGNPHATVFDSELDAKAIDEVAPRVSESLGGANIGFAHLRSANSMDLVVWERGVGRTLACGTGAAAAAAAATTSGRLPYDTPLEVRLPGGLLNVAVERETLAISSEGPAVRVYTGRLDG